MLRKSTSSAGASSCATGWPSGSATQFGCGPRCGRGRTGRRGGRIPGRRWPPPTGRARESSPCHLCSTARWDWARAPAGGPRPALPADADGRLHEGRGRLRVALVAAGRPVGNRLRRLRSAPDGRRRRHPGRQREACWPASSPAGRWSATDGSSLARGKLQCGRRSRACSDPRPGAGPPTPSATGRPSPTAASGLVGPRLPRPRPTAMSCAGPREASTGPARIPRPYGTATWTVPSRPANAPPTRCWRSSV